MSFLGKVRNVAKAYTQPMTPEITAMIERRTYYCNEGFTDEQGNIEPCPSRLTTTVGNVCRECGCPINRKASIRSESCPLGYWRAE